MNLRLSPLAGAVALAVVVSACSKENLESLNASSVQLSGVVAKGIVIGGRVTAYPIRNGVADTTLPLGSDDTDANGEYSISIVGYNGPISIVMKPVTGSKTKCDVPAGCSPYTFGQLMPMNFTMEAIVPNATGGAVSASVTPLTTMAAAYAKELGISTESAQKANEKVAKLLGLTDILSSKPVDITDNVALGSAATSADSLKYGYLSAAIAQIAKDDNSGDIDQAIKNLSSSFASNGGELITKEGTDVKSTVSLLEIAGSAKTIMDANTTVTGGVFDLTKTAIGTVASTAGAATAGSITTTTTDTVVTAGDVTKAKAIVTELRTWAQTAKTELSAQVDNTSTSQVNFAKRVDTAMSAGEAQFTSAFDAVALVGEAVGDAYLKGNGTYTLASLLVSNSAFSGAGDVVVSGTSITITSAMVKGNTVNLNLTSPVMSGKNFRLAINSFSVDNTGVTWTANSGGYFELQFDKDVSDIMSMDTETNLGDTELTETNFTQLSKLTKMSLNGGSTMAQKSSSTITEPVTFTGTASAIVDVKYAKTTRYHFVGQAYTPYVVYDMNPLPESIKFAGTFSVGGDKMEATFEGYVRNSATFKPREPLAIGSSATVGSYSFSNSGNTLTLELAGVATSSYNFINGEIVYTATYSSGGNSYSNSMGAYTSMAEFLSFPSNGLLATAYATVDGNGSYKVTRPTGWNQAGGNLAGTLTSADTSTEDAANWMDIDGKLTFVADFANLPAATITLSADRTGWKAGKGSATVSYNGVKISVDAEIAAAAGEPDTSAKVAILVDVAGKGVLEIYPDTAADSFYGTVKVDGKIVGNIKSSPTLSNALIIKYLDGTGSFESVAF